MALNDFSTTAKVYGNCWFYEAILFGDFMWRFYVALSYVLSDRRCAWYHICAWPFRVDLSVCVIRELIANAPYGSCIRLFADIVESRRSIKGKSYRIILVPFYNSQSFDLHKYGLQNTVLLEVPSKNSDLWLCQWLKPLTRPQYKKNPPIKASSKLQHHRLIIELKK